MDIWSALVNLVPSWKNGKCGKEAGTAGWLSVTHRCSLRSRAITVKTQQVPLQIIRSSFFQCRVARPPFLQQSSFFKIFRNWRIFRVIARFPLASVRIPGCGLARFRFDCQGKARLEMSEFPSDETGWISTFIQFINRLDCRPEFLQQSSFFKIFRNWRIFRVIASFFFLFQNSLSLISIGLGPDSRFRIDAVSVRFWWESLRPHFEMAEFSIG